MGTRLFVGNLSYNVNEQELREAFKSETIEVRSVRIAMDRDTGRPRGFAFVETETEEGAKQSIEKLGGRLIQGRALIIEEAQARPAPGAPRPGGPRPPGGPGGARWFVDGSRRTPTKLRAAQAPGPWWLRCTRSGSSPWPKQGGRPPRPPGEEEVHPPQARGARARQLALERDHRRRLSRPEGCSGTGM
jgi:cold-inducible RNA-binding protein